jgi:hypothetical protein
MTVIVGKGISNTQVLEDDLLSFHVHDTGEMQKNTSVAGSALCVHV